MITLFKNEDAYTIGHTAENLRGKAILAELANHQKIAEKKDFSISICTGRGEVRLRHRDGEWQQSVVSCDKVFGIINGKWCKA